MSESCTAVELCAGSGGERKEGGFAEGDGKTIFREEVPDCIAVREGLVVVCWVVEPWGPRRGAGGD